MVKTTINWGRDVSKSEDYPSGLTGGEKEIFIVFDVIDNRGTPREAQEEISRRLRIRPPHRTTITPVFRVGIELFREDPTVLTNQGINEIIKKVGYGIPSSRVVELHRLYLLWKAHKREAELKLEKYPSREAEGYSAFTDVDAIVSMPGLERRHKAWILYRWLGLDVEEIAEKLGISSESVWHDVEETEKEGVGKMEAKELKKTLDVNWLMSRFLSYLRTPDPCQVGSKQIELYETSWVEEHPLFRELKRLLDNKFWTKFRDWKKVRSQYFAKCTSFLDAVHQKAEEESQMKTTECGEEKGLNDVFWQRIYTHVLLKTKPQPLNELDRGYLKNLDKTEFVIRDNSLIAKGENTILAKGEPFQLDRVSKAYWNLVAGFTSASEPKQMWALWQELGTTEKFLNAQAGAVYEEILPNWFRYQELEI